MKRLLGNKKRIALLIVSCTIGLFGMITAYKEVATKECGTPEPRKNAAADDSTGGAVAQAECTQTEEGDYLFVGCNGFF